jgi:acyl dehydratase
MAIFYPDILEQKTAPRTFSYSDKDVMLYALGIGLGADPLDEKELAFVYERGLKVVPTAATVLAAGARAAPGGEDAAPAGLRQSQLNRVMVVHGEQKVELHRPLPASGAFTSSSRTVGVFDKGKDKGAVVVNETVWTNKAGDKIVTLTSSTFARGDGLSVDFATRPDQALLYRLNGDRNPLHSDPDFARRAGFDKPILHGLCTYGITCRAVLAAITNYDPEAILSHQVRFSAPVFPGDVITVDLWRDEKVISLEARVKARGVTVIRNGKTVLR